LQIAKYLLYYYFFNSEYFGSTKAELPLNIRVLNFFLDLGKHIAAWDVRCEVRAVNLIQRPGWCIKIAAHPHRRCENIGTCFCFCLCFLSFFVFCFLFCFLIYFYFQVCQNKLQKTLGFEKYSNLENFQN
jgi:hypothetical protein